jgi:metacaspase-1
MSQGISVHIGLNHVDPDAYPDLIVPELAGCLNDATDMQAIADDAGFSSSIYLDGDATAGAVKQSISDAASQLAPGDIFLLTYSGHGSQVPDTDNEEDDAQDETWVLYDRMLIDDELYDLWSHFDGNVRIVLLSDSCHSGTVARMLTERVTTVRNLVLRDTEVRHALGRTVKDVTALSLVRGIPADLARKTWLKRRELYDQVKMDSRRGRDLDIKASVILISGCQDNQTSLDGSGNGLFTQHLKEVWDGGSFDRDYPTFRSRISALMPVEQSPNYYTVGTAAEAFEAQKPFTIDEPEISFESGSQPSNGEVIPSQSGPSVHGPASRSRNDGPPTFSIDTGGLDYYVFEITSRPELFDQETYGEQRSSDTFYATWDDADADARMTASEFTLSADAWGSLNWADRLSFRIGVTTSQDPEEWNDYAVSTSDTDGSSAPSTALTE